MKHELSDIDSLKMDPQKMDPQKWDLLLDLLEHPEKYSETQKDELLGDEEVNELYQQLVETRQSLDLSLIHISEPTRLQDLSRMPSSA